MHLRIVAVGRVRDKATRTLLDDYLHRLRRFVQSVEEIELKDLPEAELCERFEKAIPADRAYVVALEVLGKQRTSEGLATLVDRAELDSVQTLVFLIGGSYGLPQRVSKRADLQLSLSKMTLPHRLARLFLVEQIYRAFTISRGEPYNH